MTAALQSGAARSGIVTDPLKVMIVDDSVVVRGLIGRWIDEDPSMATIAAHRNGQLAVDDIERSAPDVVVLDIEMPELDGLAALPMMLRKKPNLVVIMASTLTRRNAETSLKAMSLGAADYVPKPDSNSHLTTSAEFRRELIDKIKHLGLRARSRGAPAQRPTTAERTAARASGAQPAVTRPQFVTRPYSRVAPRVLVIGSSTGGPQALAEVFKHVGPAMSRVPVLVTQHMPPTFTAILAEHIAKVAARPCAEAVDGEPIAPGRIYIARGGLHMVTEKAPAGPVIRLLDTAPINFCKPAVDPMFESIAANYGAAVLGAVLTGMGHDGAQGAGAIADAGGAIIAQDEPSSVVWGMPGATAKAGVCSDVLPLAEIGPKLARIISGGRP